MHTGLRRDSTAYVLDPRRNVTPPFFCDIFVCELWMVEERRVGRLRKAEEAGSDWLELG